MGGGGGRSVNPKRFIKQDMTVSHSELFIFIDSSDKIFHFDLSSSAVKGKDNQCTVEVRVSPRPPVKFQTRPLQWWRKAFEALRDGVCSKWGLRKL